MRRIWIVVGSIVIATGALAYQISGNWKPYHYSGTRLMADLAQPDALIRTSSLAKLPRDLLKIPIARDVLTENLAFYYEQNEDRLGLNGAIKRIAYEHKLAWSDRILMSIFDEPAELAFWRDGKGALRHYALLMRRNTLNKVVQELAHVALDEKDSQISDAGSINTAKGKATVLALEINPRRTLLIITLGDRIVVLSDPGLLFDSAGKMDEKSKAAITEWLEKEGVLSRQFALDSVATEGNGPKTAHTMAIGAPSLSLGYAAFVPSFKGLRLDYSTAWSTSIWFDNKTASLRQLGDVALWSAAPANPSGCVMLPVDWQLTQKIITEAHAKPELPSLPVFADVEANVLACWYSEASLYAPVFITHFSKTIPERGATLRALASWAIKSEGDSSTLTGFELKAGDKPDSIPTLWHDAQGSAALGSMNDYIVFSPDATLVEKVLHTIMRSNPSVADQIPATANSLALITPPSLSTMFEREMFAALSGSNDANLLAAAQTHLPARMKALASYPQFRLESAPIPRNFAGWQQVQWQATEKAK